MNIPKSDYERGLEEGVRIGKANPPMWLLAFYSGLGALVACVAGSFL